MKSVEVKSEIRQLSANWTPEMSKDLNVYYNLDQSSFENCFAKELRKVLRREKIIKIFNDEPSR